MKENEFNINEEKNSEEIINKSIKKNIPICIFWTSVGVLLIVIIFFCVKNMGNGFDREFFEGNYMDIYIPKDYTVYYNGEKVTFRNRDGRKVSLKIEDGVIYVPLVDKGLFLDKYVEIDSENSRINLNDIELGNSVDINCEVINGGIFTNDDVAIYDYTVILNWATWCPDCDDLLSELSNNIDKLKENNIQFVGLIYDDCKDVESITKKVNKKMSSNRLNFINLIPSKDLSNAFQTNIESIPTIYIIDKYSRIVEYMNLENNSLSDIVNRILDIQESSCGKC